MKRFLQVLFSCILSLFLAIFCFAAGVGYYAQETLCNPSLLLDAASSSGYAQQVYEEIAYQWENLLSITGVETPEDIMAVLTPELVRKDALGFISDSATGTAAPDTKQLRNDLNSKVREYAYSHNIYATPVAELEQNISDLVDACIDEYESAVTVPLLPRILGEIYSYRTMIPKILIITAIGCAVMLLFLFFLHKKRQNTLYYACISIATAGVIFTAIPIIAAHYDVVNRIPFAESALRTLIVQFLQMLLDAMRYYGKVFFLGAAALFGLYVLFCLVITLIGYARKRKDTQVTQI